MGGISESWSQISRDMSEDSSSLEEMGSRGEGLGLLGAITQRQLAARRERNRLGTSLLGIIANK